MKKLIQLYCDNKAMCDIAYNWVWHDHTKHIEIDKFFIKKTKWKGHESTKDSVKRPIITKGSN